LAGSHLTGCVLDQVHVVLKPQQHLAL
jgi:hypothetical protein